MSDLMVGLSSEQMVVCYGVMLLIAVLIINSIIKRGKLIRVIIIGCALFLFFGGGGLINLNFMSSDTMEKVEQVKEALKENYGEYVKTEGNSVYVLVNDEWINLDEIEVVGEFTKDNTITYEGKEIYLGHSGVYNAVKVLEDVGLLKGEEE